MMKIVLLVFAVLACTQDVTAQSTVYLNPATQPTQQQYTAPPQPQFAPQQQPPQYAPPQYAPPQYAPPQYAPPQYAPQQAPQQPQQQPPQKVKTKDLIKNAAKGLLGHVLGGATSHIKQHGIGSIFQPGGFANLGSSLLGGAAGAQGGAQQGQAPAQPAAGGIFASLFPPRAGGAPQFGQGAATPTSSGGSGFLGGLFKGGLGKLFGGGGNSGGSSSSSSSGGGGRGIFGGIGKAVGSLFGGGGGRGGGGGGIGKVAGGLFGKLFGGRRRLLNVDVDVDVAADDAESNHPLRKMMN